MLQIDRGEAASSILPAMRNSLEATRASGGAQHAYSMRRCWGQAQLACHCRKRTLERDAQQQQPEQLQTSQEEQATSWLSSSSLCPSLVICRCAGHYVLAKSW